jgi:hypothetical protein
MGLTSFVSLSGSWEEEAGSELINESRRTDPKSHWHVMLGHCQIESEGPRTTNRRTLTTTDWDLLSVSDIGSLCVCSFLHASLVSTVVCHLP